MQMFARLKVLEHFLCERDVEFCCFGHVP